MSDIEKDTAIEGTLVDPIAVARSKSGWLDMTDLHIPGWTEVLIKDNGSYDWDYFGSWYDHDARVFYWHTDSGCSCNDPSDGIYSLGDLMQGSKPELITAYTKWCAGEYNDAVTNEERVGAEKTIRDAIRKAVQP